MEKKVAQTPHVLMFPLPIQSPVNSMLKLAELFCLSSFQVTFLNTEHNQKRLVQNTDIISRFTDYTGQCTFQVIPDGLPEENPRSIEQFDEIFSSLEKVVNPILREMLSSSSRNVTCFIADSLFYYALDIAKDVDIPLIYFDTISPCCVWVYSCIPKLIEAGEVPLMEGDDLNTLVKSVPGMEHFLRARDLPSFFRSDLENENLKSVQKQIRCVPKAQGLILNTFQDLDSTVLPQIRTQVPNLYTIGPLQKHLKNRLSTHTPSSNSFLKEDRSCMKWLDEQTEKTVLYVSIGSLTMMTKEHILEFWHGLLNGETKFLWVIRPGSVKDANSDPMFMKNLIEGIPKDVGYIVSWAPQEDVLAHSAIGGFLTHSGWNSTLESIIEAVPMICWPQYVDQNVTSRFVSDVWRFGLDMKDTCDRLEVEKMVRDLMKRRVEFNNCAEKMSKLAIESVAVGGTSHCDFERLLDHITKISNNESWSF